MISHVEIVIFIVINVNDNGVYMDYKTRITNLKNKCKIIEERINIELGTNCSIRIHEKNNNFYLEFCKFLNRLIFDCFNNELYIANKNNKGNNFNFRLHVDEIKVYLLSLDEISYIDMVIRDELGK